MSVAVGGTGVGLGINVGVLVGAGVEVAVGVMVGVCVAGSDDGAGLGEIPLTMQEASKNRHISKTGAVRDIIAGNPMDLHVHIHRYAARSAGGLPQPRRYRPFCQ